MRSILIFLSTILFLGLDIGTHPTAILANPLPKNGKSESHGVVLCHANPELGEKCSQAYPKCGTTSCISVNTPASTTESPTATLTSTISTSVGIINGPSKRTDTSEADAMTSGYTYTHHFLKTAPLKTSKKQERVLEVPSTHPPVPTPSMTCHPRMPCPSHVRDHATSAVVGRSKKMNHDEVYDSKHPMIQEVQSYSLSPAIPV